MFIIQKLCTYKATEERVHILKYLGLFLILIFEKKFKYAPKSLNDLYGKREKHKKVILQYRIISHYKL